MARSDWAALFTEPGAEYTAHTDLQRFGLGPYLPQVRRRYQTRAGPFVSRLYPLFPSYILIPINQSQTPIVRFARGLNRIAPVLVNPNTARPWRATEDEVDAIKCAEARGDFDEILHRGDRVAMRHGALAGIEAVLGNTSGRLVELLTPLFGGVKVMVDASRVVHAA